MSWQPVYLAACLFGSLFIWQPVYLAACLRGDGLCRALHQPRLAAGSGILVDDAALQGLVNHTDGFGNAGRNFFVFGGSCGDQCARLFNVSFDLRLSGLIAELALPRALNIFNHRFDIGHGT